MDKLPRSFLVWLVIVFTMWVFLTHLAIGADKVKPGKKVDPEPPLTSITTGEYEMQWTNGRFYPVTLGRFNRYYCKFGAQDWVGFYRYVPASGRLYVSETWHHNGEETTMKWTAVIKSWKDSVARGHYEKPHSGEFVLRKAKLKKERVD